MILVTCALTSNAELSNLLLGAATLAWYIIWLLIVSNDPADDKNISQHERSYIKETLNSAASEEKVSEWLF